MAEQRSAVKPMFTYDVLGLGEHGCVEEFC